MKKGYKFTPEQRAKMSARAMGHTVSPETRAKISKSTSKRLMGHKVSAETRAKIGAANSKNYKGKEISPERRAKMVAGIKKRWAENKADPEYMAKRREIMSKALRGKYTGEKASNWKGGINQNERMSTAHENWKQLVLQRDDYTCQVCKERGGFLHVDHINKFADYPELRFEPSNGRAVCRPCHYYLHFKRKMPKGSKWGIGKRVGILDLS